MSIGVSSPQRTIAGNKGDHDMESQPTQEKQLSENGKHQNEDLQEQKSQHQSPQQQSQQQQQQSPHQQPEKKNRRGVLLDHRQHQNLLQTIRKSEDESGYTSSDTDT